MAIAPYLKHGCVPDISLENISLKFKESTFFERTAIHEPRGVMTIADPAANHPAVTTVADRHELLSALRSALVSQAMPVVEALHEWSGFARRGTWGMLTSSWAAHITSLHGDSRDQRPALPILRAFFAGDDVVAIMQRGCTRVTCLGATITVSAARELLPHLSPARTMSCARAVRSCLDEERVDRNLAWMKTQLARGNGARAGHA
jgi:hypothetical protein